MQSLKIRLNVGTRQFVVNFADLTWEKKTDLEEKISQVRAGHSIFARFPMEPDESREKWRERIEPLLEKDIRRREDESPEEHLARLFDSKQESGNQTLEVLNSVAEVFGLQKVSEEEFKKVNWLDLRSFLYDVLGGAGVSNDEFFPFKPLER